MKTPVTPRRGFGERNSGAKTVVPRTVFFLTLVSSCFWNVFEKLVCFFKKLMIRNRFSMLLVILVWVEAFSFRLLFSFFFQSLLGKMIPSQLTEDISCFWEEDLKPLVASDAVSAGGSTGE